MIKNLYHIRKGNLMKVTVEHNLPHDLIESDLYVYDIVTNDKTEAIVELKKMGISDRICQNILNPKDNIRFKTYEDALYSELSYFSSKTKDENYASIIIYKNVLIGIHATNEDVIQELFETVNSFSKKQKEKVTIEFFLFGFIQEILSNYGKLILAYREEIELLADDFEHEKKEISPSDILEAKSQLYTFSRVLEKLYYTLSFPPTKDVLDFKSTYHITFNYLLKSVKLLKSSLNQTEERLNSLNDHYQLLLHDKSNSRLNLLTIIQAIFLPLTLIVGIYGMNFINMNELKFEHGYSITIGVMILISVGILVYFKKTGWFN